MSGQSDEVKNEAGTCGPGCSCNCGSGGAGKGGKWLISGIVVFAACAVVAARVLFSVDVLTKKAAGGRI